MRTLDFKMFSFWKTLKTLKASHNCISEVVIERLPRLRHLNLSHNKCAASLTLWLGSKFLPKLCFSSCSLPRASLIPDVFSLGLMVYPTSAGSKRSIRLCWRITSLARGLILRHLETGSTLSANSCWRRPADTAPLVRAAGGRTSRIPPYCNSLT